MDALGTKDRETDAYIVDRLRGALAIMKAQKQNEEVRLQRRLLLTAVAPELVEQGDQTGMQKRVAERLEVDRNLAPFRNSVQKRSEIDRQWKELQEKDGFKVGDQVVCKHGAG